VIPPIRSVTTWFAGSAVAFTPHAGQDEDTLKGRDVADAVAELRRLL
jgi:hypothetical protein